MAAAAAAVCAVAFATSSWVVMPLAVGQALAAWAAADAERRAAVRRIAVNPFTLTITLHELALAAPGVSVEAERVSADFRVAALFSRTVALDGLDVVKPHVRLHSSRLALGGELPASLPVAHATLTEGRIEWLDDVGPPLVLDGVTMGMFGATGSSDTPARFDIDVRDVLGGVATLAGDVTLRPFAASGRVHLDNIDPEPLAQRVFASASLAGAISGTADFEWRPEPAALRLANMSVRGIGAAIDWPNGALAAASIEAVGAAELGRGHVLLDGEIDLQDAVLRADSDLGLRAARVTWRNAVAALRRTDGSGPVLVELASPAFAAQPAPANAAEEPGSFRLRAELDAARGSEVALEFANVPTGLFAAPAQRLGYRVDGGRVDASIDYRVAADGIEGTAQLGTRGAAIERVEGASPDMTLALALLEDAEGVTRIVIDLGAPREELDRVGLAATLAAGAAHRLDAVAAAPFDALGAAVGVEGAALERVGFRPGHAAPRDDAVLGLLAEALHARPRVGLRVPGVADRALDLPALAAQQIEQHVTLATTGPSLTARSLPVDFASPRHRDVLDEFAGERLSAERRETIASYFTRGPDGRIAEAERSAYYRAVFDALVANEMIPDSSIERLGRFRARAIADGLAALGIEPARIEIEPVVVHGSDATTEADGAAESPAGDDGRSVELPLAVFVSPGAAR